ncbi:MAG: hypothetical protein DDG60_00035 [Anaerolineae bacterium]|nr:MAG: hypothetical protein DDG60_00035 [Anaerolineae bacterium]
MIPLTMQKSSSFFVAHLRENQRLHLLGAGALVVVFLILYGWRWPEQALWLVMAAFGVVLPFSFFYHRIERSAWSPQKQYQAALHTAFLQGCLDVLLIAFLIHNTGGYDSPLALLYLITLGSVAVFFHPRQMVILNLWAMAIYSGLMLSYVQGWLTPSYLPLQPQNTLGLPFAPLIWVIYLIAMTVNWLVIKPHADRIHSAWADVDQQNEYLHQLLSLTRLGLERRDLPNLYQTLADEVRVILNADAIYLTRWEEDNAQVHQGASSHRSQQPRPALAPLQKHEASLTLSALRAGIPLLVKDVNCSPYLSQTTAQRFSETSLLAVPLYGLPEHRYLGALLVGYTNPHDFSQTEIKHAQQVADVAALLISRMSLFHETQYRASLLEQMAGQITLLTCDLRRTTLLPSIVESARSLLDAQRAALHLYDPVSKKMECRYSVGLSEEYLQFMTEHFEKSPEAATFQEQRFVLIPDVGRDERTSPMRGMIARERFHAYAVFALESEEGSLGTLSLYWDEPHAITSVDVTVGQLFARRAAAMLQSATLYEQAAKESLTDSLTNLPNRRYFDRRLKEECERASRSGRPVALLMIDLDGFKAINDSFGHAIGDSVIQQIGTAIRQSIRSTDMVARFGGDEFAIIFPEADKEAALRLAEKIKSVLASTKLHLPRDTQRYVSASIGIALCPVESDNPQTLFELADQRMFRAKRTQPGTIVSEGK